MIWCSGAQNAGRVEFAYWRCVSKEILDEEADLILVVEVIDIQRIRDPLRNHFDFGLAAKVVETKKRNYDKQIMGLHVPRQVPLERYNPKKYTFEQGKRFTIKAKVDDKGKVTIFDPRVRPAR